MLEWASPLWFLALPLALALPWLARRPRLAFGSLDSVHTPMTLRSALAWTPQALASIAMALLVVALARPQYVHRERYVEHEGIDIMLVLDTSGSMEVDDYNLGGRSTSRLEVAKEVMARFVEGRPDDRIGLVVFGEEAFTQVPLTLDHDAYANILGQVRIGVAGDRATAVGDAMAVAGKRLKELQAESRVMVLLTDGRNNAGQVSPMQAAEAAKALGIRVYTIGVGSSGGGGGGLFGMFGRRADLDEATLQRIAQITDARYFRASDTQALQEVYETIDQLEKSTAEVSEFVLTEERYHAALGSGLVLLVVQVLLANSLFRRLP